jgi:hypothetical protein
VYLHPLGITRCNTSHRERVVREFMFYTNVKIYSYTPVQVVGLEADQTPTTSIFLLSFNIYFTHLWNTTVPSANVPSYCVLEHGSLHQTAIRDSAFTPAHWWLYSHFIALPLGWEKLYSRSIP